MNIEQYKLRFYNLIECEVGNVKPLIIENVTNLENMKLYWTSCGGDVVELLPESKKN